MDAAHVAFLLRAFGDGTRLRILGLLSRTELSVGELARVLACPIPRASRHLKYLEARGIVESQAVANSVVYRLAPAQDEVDSQMLLAFQRCMERIREVREDKAKVKRPKSGAGRAGRGQGS